MHVQSLLDEQCGVILCLLIKEALYTRLTDLELINRDEGVTITECWQPVLDHATMTSSTHATPHRGTDDGTIDAT